MGQALTEAVVRDLVVPTSGNRIEYDKDVKGFGVRVTTAGSKSFVLNYRQAGRERRITIGSYPDWSVKAARDKARSLKRDIDVGADPMVDRHTDRGAPTINDLADRFDREHVAKRRASTQSDYKTVIRLYVRPELGKVRVAEVRHEDIERLHARISCSHPYQANRTLAVVGKMFALAIKWGMRPDNPARGIEQSPEHKRQRFLTPPEIARLGEALATVTETASANAIRLMLLTGARKGEVLKARWSEFDLATGVWTKPSAHTKTKKDHRVPLSAPARLLLTEMRTTADKEVERGGKAEFVFPSDHGDKPIGDVKRTWATVSRTAGFGKTVVKFDTAGKSVTAWVPNARMHDLRHTYASILASHGLSLPIIGQLLGHTQAQTTHRYAHLLDDPLRAATERVGAVVSGGKTAEVVLMPKARG